MKIDTFNTCIYNVYEQSVQQEISDHKGENFLYRSVRGLVQSPCGKINVIMMLIFYSPPPS